MQNERFIQLSSSTHVLEQATIELYYNTCTGSNQGAIEIFQLIKMALLIIQFQMRFYTLPRPSTFYSHSGVAK